MQAPAWSPEPFETDEGNVPFERFLDNLSDFKAEAVLRAIEIVLAVGGIDLVRTEWLKPLGQGLHEFRVRHNAAEVEAMFGHNTPRDRSGAPESVLVRVFVHFYGDKVILLLGGYDKGDDPSQRRQQREIDLARKLLVQFKEGQRRLRKPKRKNS